MTLNDAIVDLAREARAAAEVQAAMTDLFMSVLVELADSDELRPRLTAAVLRAQQSTHRRMDLHSSPSDAVDARVLQLLHAARSAVGLDGAKPPGGN